MALMLNSKLVEIVARNFGLELAQITPATNADTVPQWDSVGHLKLILDVEETFAVRFSAMEVVELTSVGRIQIALQQLAEG
jgi:acyl carrier protein